MSISKLVNTGNMFLIIHKAEGDVAAALWAIGFLFVLVTSPLWISPIVGIGIGQGFLFLTMYVVFSSAISLIVRWHALSKLLERKAIIDDAINTLRSSRGV